MTFASSKKLGLSNFNPRQTQGKLGQRRGVERCSTEFVYSLHFFFFFQYPNQHSEVGVNGQYWHKLTYWQLLHKNCCYEYWVSSPPAVGGIALTGVETEAMLVLERGPETESHGGAITCTDSLWTPQVVTSQLGGAGWHQRDLWGMTRPWGTMQLKGPQILGPTQWLSSAKPAKQAWKFTLSIFELNFIWSVHRCHAAPRALACHPVACHRPAWCCPSGYQWKSKLKQLRFAGSFP